MRLVIAGATALLALAACQERTAKAPGADVETGATGSTDSMVTQPPTQDSAAIAPDTTAKTDTSSKGGGAVGKDSVK